MITKLKNILRRLWALYKAYKPVRVLDYYNNKSIPPVGRVLINYIPEPLLWKEDDRRFGGHSNLWESREIARIFNEFGYVVDCISFLDDRFAVSKKYDIVFDIFKNIEKYSNLPTHKILHLTGSDPLFAKEAELKRIKNLKLRKGFEVKPRRVVPEKDIHIFHTSILQADTLTLIGNATTVSTFPLEIQGKINCIPGTGSLLNYVRTPAKIEFRKEFLWYAGAGAVHKGLDLVLEAFLICPECKLHLVGPYEEEGDFMNAYGEIIRNTDNIVSHGYLFPGSERFKEITQYVIAFIAPSCSEGTATAAVTCMQYGFLPIISKNVGISITEFMGILLNECSVEEIVTSLKCINEKKNVELKDMITKSQAYASEVFSRQNFHHQMKNVIFEISEKLKK
ncbi:glycosyltransferase [Filimonas effusa]|uniref:Glycosyltransferase family 1 protein n=1 Tax=Filimonas effusa TaxID=2508721 RepID=A0A4Q1D1U4_9BACT|nr:glycosyltransferase [Filimonas effusa]RXK81848.1 glycosyltransferase family 1 protein [Filimonas effusa]